MKRIKAPSHRTLSKQYLKDRTLQKKVKAGVQRLKIIRQIIDRREALGLTQAAMAQRMGVSQAFVAKIENDEMANLGLETLVKLANALNGEIEIRIRPFNEAA